MPRTKKEKPAVAAPAEEKSAPKTPAPKVKTKPKARAKVKTKAPRKASAPKKPRKAKAKKRAAPPRRKAPARRAFSSVPVVKKVIQSADAVSLRTLVETVKHGHLEAEKVFRRAVAKARPSVGQRATAIIETMGLLPTTAGQLALLVAELELRTGAAQPDPVEVSFELDGQDVSVLCSDDKSAETVRHVISSLDEAAA